MCLGKPHVSFPSELAVRRICCFVWSAESEGKLSGCSKSSTSECEIILLFHGK